MLRQLVLPAVSSAALMFGQAGTQPKATPGDYPAQAAAGPITVAAEYTGHSFSGAGRTFVAADYLVVEVALYVPPKHGLTVDQGHFRLRVNGKKDTLTPQSAEFVAASLKYPNWEEHPRVEGGVGPVILGRPAPVERFPGDPTARRRVPPPEDHSEIEKAPTPKAEEIVLETALPEGEVHPPVSGYLYFRFTRRLKSIRSLELLYTGPDGEAGFTLVH